MSYVKNADLTIEYIIHRAFALGALSIYTDIEPGHQRAIVMEWPDGTMTYPMAEYGKDYYHHQGSFADLPALRRSVEDQGRWLKLVARAESSEDRLERQAAEHLEAAARHRDNPMF